MKTCQTLNIGFKLLKKSLKTLYIKSNNYCSSIAQRTCIKMAQNWQKMTYLFLSWLPPKCVGSHLRPHNFWKLLGDMHPPPLEAHVHQTLDLQVLATLKFKLTTLKSVENTEYNMFPSEHNFTTWVGPPALNCVPKLNLFIVESVGE